MRAPSMCEEPPEHYEAIHAAEAAVQRGDILEARRLFRIAELAAASWESKEHCRRRRDDVSSRHEKPRWNYKAFSDVKVSYDHAHRRVEISANILDLPSSVYRLIKAGGLGNVYYEPFEYWDDDESGYDPGTDHARIEVYADTPLLARWKLNEVCAFLVRLAKADKIKADDCQPQWRPGDAYLLKVIRE